VRPLLVVALLAACGGGPARPDYPTPDDIDGEPDRVASTPAAAPPPSRTTEIGRAELDAILAPGPGALLGRVRVAAEARDGRFHGWRIVALPDGARLELEVGDVVRSVNGQGLERPEHLSAVWEALRTAPEVVIGYERAGEPRTWRLPVVDSPP
jgi:hypothetical protein